MAGAGSVEEMMARLKQRFKAAGLETKTDTMESSNLVEDESRCVTQLKTYVKLCSNMGASFVINGKARNEIFDSIRIHANSAEVLIQALTCLNLLLIDAQKDARKKDQITKEVFDGAFQNTLQNCQGHLTNSEFAVHLVNFFSNLCMGESSAQNLVNAEGQLQQIVNSVKGDAAVADAVARFAQAMETARMNAMNSDMSFGAMGGGMGTNTMSNEFDMLADGDLLDLDDDFGLGGGNSLVGNMSFGANPQFGNFGAQQVMPSDMVPKHELDEARALITQYQVDIQALSAQLQQIQFAYQADQEVHNNFVVRLQETETSHRREKIEMQQKIGTLEQINKELRGEISTLQESGSGSAEALAEKETEFQNMKVMVSNQMNQMRAHYITLKNEYDNAASLNSMLQEQTKSSQSRITSLEEQLKAKNAECEEAHKSLVVWQNKCQEAQEVLVGVKKDNQDQLSQANRQLQEMQAQYGTLVNQHQGLYAMNESLKQQYVQLKMEYNSMQQRTINPTGNNVELMQLQQKTRAQEQENAELKAMVDTLLQMTGQK